MQYDLKISDETIRVEMNETGDGKTARFDIGEKTYEVLHRSISERHFHLVVDGKAAEVFVARGPEGKYVFLNGQHFLVQENGLPKAGGRRKGLDEGPKEVTPPMPAVVVRILVESDQEVTKGQGLVVVSAMKMETTLAAPKEGRVRKINTSVGAKVAPGDILVEIEEREEQNG